MVSISKHRVSDQTDPAINEHIRRQTEQSIAYFAAHPDEIGHRLGELDREWDIERTLETMSSSLTLFGFLMSIVRRQRRWLVIPLAVQSFFLQHAIQGWCPPLPLLRKLGLRTQDEIEQERYALKALRGDFRDVDPANYEESSGSGHNARHVMEAIER